ncbi:phage tail protein [Azospirillum sp. TSH100]|uniref:phage tail protein n=1 Tax=Azospirillum sp. TSH100 TaxID=652764 RepID=UPI000D651172|nr:tail fiber protein [Azospirillum sp. TSH100]QCG92167.1 phage tail protein [Azospirillum sp. TSH100]
MVADYFLGELRLFGFAWAPADWALCDGATLTIAQNAALNSLLGSTFGGDGKTNFNIPDLRGRTPLAMTTNSNRPANAPITTYQAGKAGGSETVVVTTSQLPAHTHSFKASSSQANSATLRGSIFADVIDSSPTYCSTTASTTALDPASIDTGGGNAGHANIQPFLVLNYCICTSGIYPSRN